jgi:cell division protein FtsX
LAPGLGGFVPWLIVAVAIVSFAAGLEIVAATAAVRSLQAWPARLAGSATVAVTGRDLESPDAAAARTVELLSGDPRIATVWVLDPSPQDALIARLIGARAAFPSDAPPRLVAVAIKPGIQATADDVRRLLRTQNLGAAVDDHGLWTGPLERAAALGGVGALLAMIALLATVHGVAAWSSERAFIRARDQVALLLQMGASDERLAKLFRGRLALPAVFATLLGAAAAVGLAGVLAHSAGVADHLAARGITLPALDSWDLLPIMAWPPLAVLLALGAADAAGKAGVRSLS